VFGARPLKRAIQRLIEDKISEEILLGNIKAGDKVKVDVEEDQVIVRKGEKG
jgi:ATP-dependent Clp protease ATP-binding subunit ClpC